MSDLETTPLSQLDESAHNFVVSSWVRSWWRGVGKGVDAAVYHRSFPRVVKHLVKHADVRILHFPDNTDFYVGWIAQSGRGALHYIYIRQAFRRQGNAQELLKALLNDDATYSLQPATAWKRQWASNNGLKYDPYQIAVTTIGADSDEQEQK